jgi:FtsH ternary system domain X5
MSRAYRVSVRESLTQVVRGEDRVSTTLELLEILPCEAMAELLREELARRGFEDRDGKMVREGDAIAIEVDPASGEVVVRSEVSKEIVLKKKQEGYADTDHGKRGREAVESALRGQLQKELEADAKAKAEEIQDKATARLEGELQGLKAELDQVVNRVTAEALKRKAAQIGQIKQITEDTADGSMTIVLEV